VHSGAAIAGNLTSSYASPGRSALDQLYLNGRKPEIEVRKFVLPPSKNWNSLSPGERVFAEGQEVLRMVAVPDPDEQRLNAGIFN
jgi:hypothetical protein